MLPQGELRIEAVQLSRIAARFGIGELLPALRGEQVWLDTDEQDAAERAALDVVGQAGLLERGGQLDRDFADTLAALCHPELAYIAWCGVGGRTWQVVTVLWGREAVRAVASDGVLLLQQIPTAGLVSSLLERLPSQAPARFQPMRVPTTAFQQQPRESGDSFLVNISYTAADEQRDNLLRLSKARRDSGSELFIQTRDRVGRVSKTERPVGYVTGEYGAWFNLIETDQHGNQYLIAAPATPDALARSLNALQAELTQTT